MKLIPFALPVLAIPLMATPAFAQSLNFGSGTVTTTITGGTFTSSSSQETTLTGTQDAFSSQGFASASGNFTIAPTLISDSTADNDGGGFPINFTISSANGGEFTNGAEVNGNVASGTSSTFSQGLAFSSTESAEQEVTGADFMQNTTQNFNALAIVP